MQMKIKEKMIAVVMAFAMMFTFIFAGDVYKRQHLNFMILMDSRWI